MFKGGNKILIYVLIAVAIVFLGVYFYSQSKNNEFQLITNDEELAEFMMNMKEGDQEAYLAWRDEQYAKDTYGGDTPEETLEMYIEALKSGDVELASKYFRLEDQERELGELRELKKNNISEYIEFIDSGDYNNSCNELLGWCELGTDYEGEDILIARFIQNTQTGKWKMESL